MMGGKRVTGFSPKFFMVVGGTIVLLIVAAIALQPSSKPVFNPLLCPAFPLQPGQAVNGCVNPDTSNSDTLATLKSGWVGQYGSPTANVQSVTTFTGVNYAPSIGQVFTFQAYLPPSSIASTRPDLERNTRGWTFMPAILVTSNHAQTLSDLQQSATTVLGGQSASSSGTTIPDFNAISKPLMIGFNDASVPVIGQSGTVVTVTAMLWWRSDYLTSSGANVTPAPVFLAGNWAAVSPVELAAPTTQEANLDLVYQENQQQLIVHDVEWSTLGDQMRVCVSVTNDSLSPLALWSGFSNMMASNPGLPAETGTPDSSVNLSTGGQMLSGQPLSDYIDFSQTVNPNLPLTLNIPNLPQGETTNSTSQDGIVVTIPVSKIHPVSTVATDNQTSPCDTVAASSSASGGGGGSNNGS